jgi:pimeloyl-ACP methyl ester carboxylesterase
MDRGATFSQSNRRRFLAGAASALVAAGAATPTARAQEATPQAASEPAAPPTTFDQAAFDATFSHHTAVVGEVRLHYVIGGQGDPLVLLHGWPQTWYEWREVMPALAQRFTVIAPDLRGLGDSSKPLTGYDTRTVAADIHGLVQQLGFREILLASHDIGSWVAHAYAAGHRDEVRRLAVMEVMPTDDTLIQMTTLNPEIPFWHPSFHFVRDLPEALIAGKERLYLSWFYRTAAYNPAAFTEEAIDEYVRCYSAEAGMRPGFEYYRALFTDIEQTKEDAVTPLEMPVLALGGEMVFGPFMEMLWAPYATDLKVEVIPQAGHWVTEEQPEMVAERLLAFFG